MIRPTVLVMGAGSGGGNNWIRSLRKSGVAASVVGSNCQPHSVAKSGADVSVLLPRADSPDYPAALRQVIATYGVDVLAPTSDTEVEAVARHAPTLAARTFLPTLEEIDICQDKGRFSRLMHAAGVPVARAVNLSDVDSLDAALACVEPAARYWLRPRRGSGSKGACWFNTAEQGRAFLRLWEQLRGASRLDYQVCEFLPGRDYAVQTLWHRGELVVAKMVERIAYYGAAGRMSGMSSTPEIALTVRDSDAMDIALAAVRAVSDEPHGVFSLDMKAGGDGEMRVTEVNVGRCCMITTIFDETGRLNTVGAYVRCAMDEPPHLDDPIDIEEGWMLIRDLDCEPTVVHESEVSQ